MAWDMVFNMQPKKRGALRVNARRAYELGRINRAALAGGIVLALEAFSMARHGAAISTIVVASVTFGLSVLMTSWSAAGERGVRVGAVASMVMVLGTEGGCFLDSHTSGRWFCSAWYAIGCIASVLISAIAIVLFASDDQTDRFYWVSAFTIVLLMAVMICTLQTSPTFSPSLCRTAPAGRF